MDGEIFPLSDLPEVCLIHVLSYLPGKELMLVCSRVNKYWKELIDSQILWHKKCLRQQILFTGLVHDHDFDYQQYFFKNPYTRNLLKNYKALDGVKHWSLTKLGDHYRNGSMFILEDKPSGADPLENYVDHHYGEVKNWVTSYIYASREQTIDLLAEGCHANILDNIRPPLMISEWYAGRLDCGSEYDMEVKLFDEHKAELLDSFQFNCNLNAGRSWFQIRHVFDAYPPGVRFVHFRHGGKDRKYWAGHYGVKMALPTVQFLINDL